MNHTKKLLRGLWVGFRVYDEIIIRSPKKLGSLGSSRV